MGEPHDVRKVNLTAMFGRFHDQWSPKVVGQVNDSLVKLVKLKGEFVWHHHDNEDELFLVVKGRLRLKLRDQDVVLGPGEFAIIPAASSTCRSPTKRHTSCYSSQYDTQHREHQQ